MSDHFELIAKIAADTSKEVLKHSMESLSTTLSLIPRSIKLLFNPLERLIVKKEEIQKRSIELIKKQVNSIPDEKLIEPDPSIAIPAIEQITNLYNSDDLKTMYANLLKSSMNIDTKNKAHPAFIEIIKQLSSDEAKLIKSFSRRKDFPLIDMHLIPPNGGYHVVFQYFTNIADGVCENPSCVMSYINNLIRLGIIEVPALAYLKDKEIYKPLENHPMVLSVLSNNQSGGFRYEIKKRKFEVTAFGKNFIETCVL